jgi:hypothetical protein
MTGARSLRPLLVLGSPRSGTSMMGHYLGTSDAVVHLGEYGAIYVTSVVMSEFAVAARLSGRPPSEHVRRYIDEARRLAVEFPSRIDAPGATFWCDSSPLNLVMAGRLDKWLPDAHYVLMVRRYSGVLPSLARCFQRGEMWAGATWEQRATLWSRYYAEAPRLPADRVTVVSYDRLCAEPAGALAELKRTLEGVGIPAASLDDSALATSWATAPDETRPTVATLDPEGTARMGPVPAAQLPWSAGEAARLEATTAPARAALVAAFPELSGWV